MCRCLQTTLLNGKMNPFSSDQNIFRFAAPCFQSMCSQAPYKYPIHTNYSDSKLALFTRSPCLITIMFSVDAIKEVQAKGIDENGKLYQTYMPGGKIPEV